MRKICRIALAGALLPLLLAASSATAQVAVAEAEAFYRTPGVFRLAAPAGQPFPTRFPSLSADGRQLAYLRAGRQELALRNITTGTQQTVPAPGITESGRDFSISLDGRVVAFASDPPVGKSSCGREIALRNVLTGARRGFSGASCLRQPSKPSVPQLDLPFGYASNVRPDGVPSPSNSLDLYRRRPAVAGAKGEDDLLCLTCAQDPGDSGEIAVSTFSSQPLSAIAYRENRNLWSSPDGSRLAFLFSVAYQTCPLGDADCGESGLVVVDVDSGGTVVLGSVRTPARNRFIDLQGSADGQRFVFSTTASLLPADTDSGLDVYLYELRTKELRLISDGLDGAANDPRISGNGRYLTFWYDSIGRRLPAPTDVEAVACATFFDPVDATSRLYVVDLQAATPRRAMAIEESLTFGNRCNATTTPLREATDINHSGTLIAVATPLALAAGDSNGAEDVHLVDNAFARQAIFDHSFD